MTLSQFKGDAPVIDVTKTVYYRNKPVLFLGTTPDGRLIFQTKSKIGRPRTILTDRIGCNESDEFIVTNAKRERAPKEPKSRFVQGDTVWCLISLKQGFQKATVKGNGKVASYLIILPDGSEKQVMGHSLFASFEDAVSMVEGLRKSLYAQEKLGGPTTIIRKVVGNAAGATL